MDMEWNEEPMDAPRNTWLQRIPQMAQQGAGLVAQGIQAMQATPDYAPEEALRQLRMERARRSYEQRFGMPAIGAGGREMSLYAQNRQGDVDALLARLRLAQQQGWRR